MPVTCQILPHPGANAVFFGASDRLRLAELTLCAARIPGSGAPRVEPSDGLPWLKLDLAEEPSGETLAALSDLSFAYAVFLRRGDLLEPISLPQTRLLPDSVSSILKYTGKTNHLFTRLLLRLAELSLPELPDRPLRVLDPVAGKGTTLFEAAARGWDAAGVEISEPSARDGAVFFRKFLETERLKHTQEKIRNHGAPSWSFTWAPDKEALRGAPHRLTLIAGDSARCVDFFGKSVFDMAAGDLPYGVQHGSVAGADRLRSPLALLERCLPAWHAVLRPRGILALSWNTYVLSASDLLRVLASHGFEPLRDPPLDALEHRVDASIVRDAVFALRV